MTGLHKLFLAFFTALAFTLPVLAQDVSQEAKRHMFRGQAAMEEAELTTDASGYRDAITEFKQATRLAPDWADAWFNLGVAQEKAEDYSGAMESFKRYLVLAPDAPDYAEVGGLIFKLEYKRDKAQQLADKTNIIEGLSGEWLAKEALYQVSVSEDSIKISYMGYTHPNGKFYSFYSNSSWKMNGTITGLNFTGTGTFYFGEKKFSRPCTGNIDELGNKIYLDCTMVSITKTDNNDRATSWRDEYIKKELIKKK